MDSEQLHPISAEEARSSLAEIDRIGCHIRRTIAAGRSAYLLILWGSIWIIGFLAEQFFRASGSRLWLGLDAIGIAASFLTRWRRNAPVKDPNNTRIGLSWMVLFLYAALWCSLIAPWEIAHNPGWLAYAPFMERKMALLWVTVCMFAYVLIGLWLDRFFLWLGGLVTLAAVLGYFFIAHYFFLWIAIAGGGSLIVSGLFIRNSWR